ncbi:MAG: hypothetical protein LBQ61_10675 [Spirochaetales bacterium]|jgi:uncharacterized membrane protein|nr:hypothetical protein [Spirochaetales bacterium]
MIDSYKLITEIESIYKQANSLKEIKRKSRKQYFGFAIFPIILYFLSSFLLILSQINNFFVLAIIASIATALSPFVAYYGYDHLLRIKSGIYTTSSTEQVFFYNFKQEILKKGISKNMLIAAESILQIETKEDVDYLLIYFMRYLSLIAVPATLIVLHDFIEKNINVLFYLIIMAVLLPAMMFALKVFTDGKKYIKKNILKNIKRIIIEM